MSINVQNKSCVSKCVPIMPIKEQILIGKYQSFNDSFIMSSMM